MPEPINGTLDASVQETISKDAEFQTSLEGLTDDEKSDAISKKSGEVREAIFKAGNEKITKSEEIANNQKIRAEKAEDELKEVKPPTEEEIKEDKDLSSSDVLALINAKVPQEDIEEVKGMAKRLGKTITETLADDVTNQILETRAEHRKTAEAANVDGARPAANDVSDEQLLSDFSQGKVPEKGSPGAERLFKLRHKSS